MSVLELIHSTVCHLRPWGKEYVGRWDLELSSLKQGNILILCRLRWWMVAISSKCLANWRKRPLTNRFFNCFFKLSFMVCFQVQALVLVIQWMSCKAWRVSCKVYLMLKKKWATKRKKYFQASWLCLVGTRSFI